MSTLFAKIFSVTTYKSTLRIASIFLGAFFIVSGIGKLLDVHAFQQLLFDYGFGPFAYHNYFKRLIPIIPGLEIYLGFALIFWVKVRFHSLISTILLLLFTLAFANGYFLNGVEDCGCFGVFDFLKTSPTVSFIRNAFLMALAAHIYWYYPKNDEEAFPTLKRVFIAFVTVVAVSISGTTLHQGYFSSNQFEGQLLSETPLAEYLPPSDFENKTALVFLFGYGCPHCWDNALNVNEYVKSQAVDTVIGFGAGSIEHQNYFMETFKPEFAIKTLQPNQLMALTDKVPTAYYLENGKVILTLKSRILSPYHYLQLKNR